MFLFNPWLLLAPAFGLITLLYAKWRSSKIWVRNSVIFLVLAYSAKLWTTAHFEGAGCTGAMLTSISCPEEWFLTKIALLHEVVLIIGTIYFHLALALPLVFLGIFVSERQAT